MAVLEILSALALRPLVEGWTDSSRDSPPEKLAQLFRGWLTDQSQRLPRALALAHRRAWQALELALAGPSWWNRCKGLLTSGEERAFRQQVQTFLDAALLQELQGQEAMRQECLRQLRQARALALLDTPANPSALAEAAAGFARFQDPARRAYLEERGLYDLGQRLRQAGLPHLAWVVSLRPDPSGPPLLLLAFRYFFRREVEADSRLFQGLTHARLESFTRGQEEGLAALHEALASSGQKLEALLGSLHEATLEARDAALETGARVRQLQQQLGQVMEHLRTPTLVPVADPARAERQRQAIRQGHALLRAGRYEEARSAFGKLLDEEPGLISARAGVLLSALLRGDMSEAALTYQTLREEGADDPVFGRLDAYFRSLPRPAVLWLSPAPSLFSYDVRELQAGRLVKELVEQSSGTVNLGDVGELLLQRAETGQGVRCQAASGSSCRLLCWPDRLAITADYVYRSRAIGLTLTVHGEPFEIFRLARFVVTQLAGRFKRTRQDWLNPAIAARLGEDAAARGREWDHFQVDFTTFIPQA